jgi:hypothetical protein
MTDTETTGEIQSSTTQPIEFASFLMETHPSVTMLANPDIGVTQIVGVSPATLYRYIPATRTANAPEIEAKP